MISSTPQTPQKINKPNVEKRLHLILVSALIPALSPLSFGIIYTLLAALFDRLVSDVKNPKSPSFKRWE
jgi:hypothetical protein